MHFCVQRRCIVHTAGPMGMGAHGVAPPATGLPPRAVAPEPAALCLLPHCVLPAHVASFHCLGACRAEIARLCAEGSARVLHDEVGRGASRASPLAHDRAYSHRAERPGGVGKAIWHGRPCCAWCVRPRPLHQTFGRNPTLRPAALLRNALTNSSRPPPPPRVSGSEQRRQWRHSLAAAWQRGPAASGGQQQQ